MSSAPSILAPLAPDIVAAILDKALSETIQWLLNTITE